ncbi:hypothetical protein [Paenibacillus xylanexedens]|uniref:hypothetical protein n=1 Tax=Paenibacillus xylanexedens TaxID=528191 RepID=UPI000F549CBF|nr:hypothetical protein [Paenibacillus xylanexedens]
MAKRENKDAVINLLLNMLHEYGAMSFMVEDRIADLYHDDLISAKYADKLCAYVREDSNEW